ncbi:MAG: site-specific DNA-methyltransferase [Planctomycetes bacterium]|nr:site-specific DNA-methyltransferase [Planctomycetota bacterium]
MLTLSKKVTGLKQNTTLDEIERLDQDLYHDFKDKFHLDVSLSRALVSFQANKSREVYRWYKFKEAFSASLVEYLLEKDKIVNGTILDPFAGSGTALFAAIAKGIHADGIELLRIGQQIINTKKIVELELTKHDYGILNRWLIEQPWKTSGLRVPLNELRITKDAYPEQTKDAIERYMGVCDQENERVRAVLQFALLCILESISYTRKDGQYLRWDYRSGRRQVEKPFDKGDIFGFDDAICNKIKDVLFDSQTKGKQKSLFPSECARGKIKLYCGSCLDILPTIPACGYDAIITSPPYCNRYDYTRTYALELALSGIGEQELVNLRQQMLSCTVENRTKDLLAMNHDWAEAIAAADQLEALQAVLKYLDEQKAQGLLNNNGIPRMVRGYFYEMACVIAECSRVLKPNAPLFMVNDNVRFAGASISVDMILSSIAEKLGFRVENILVLPNGKGNSSQQMGKHGREMLRKCVYIWRSAG